jgi:hypothetical protein
MLASHFFVLRRRAEASGLDGSLKSLSRPLSISILR